MTDATVRRRWLLFDLRGYALATVLVVVAAFACYPLHRIVGQATVSMVFLLCVVTVAGLGRVGAASYAAVLSLLAFDFVYVPPFLGFSFRHTEYLFAFTVILAVGILVGTLTVRLQNQLAAARAATERTLALHALARDLAVTRGIESILEAAVRNARAMLRCDAAILLGASEQELAVRRGDPARLAPASVEMLAARLALRERRPVGAGTSDLHQACGLHVPLVASQGTLGVMSFFADGTTPFSDPERRHLAEAAAHLVALAVECDQLTERGRRGDLEISAERQRNALLSSVSHGLRTPLAAITGAATSLLEQDALLDAAARRELAETIADESEHMERTVANLLDMGRFEGGGLRLRREPQAIGELIGGALTMLGRRLRGREVRVDAPADLPPLLVDGPLVQEVLVNLLDNADKYTPAGSPIEVGACATGRAVEVRVGDRGPGLPSGDRSRLFEKFFQGANARRGGVGLGLAICRTIVEAHGGAISAADRVDGGAEFRFTLPSVPLPTGAPR